MREPPSPESQRVFAPGILDGQVALVTGGGSGIGLATAAELARLGARVAIAGRTMEKLEAARADLVGRGVADEHVHTATCDIREPEQVEALVKGVVARWGGIDILVNNAGGQFPSPLAVISQRGWEAVVRTNLTGGFLVAREVFLQSMNRHGGSIVNITADFWGGMPGMGHSGAARAGMDNFTKTAAYEWGCCGVRVNAVAPGWIMSSGMETYPEGFKQVIRKLKDAVPIKRMGHEAEVSSVICFLLSEAASFVSGTNVRIDGAASQGNAAVFELPAMAPAIRTESKPWDGFHRENLPAMFRE